MYTGVPLKILLEEAGLKPKAKWLLLEGADAAAMTRSLPLAKALDDCLIAYRMNGEMLRPENGYPVARRGAGLGSQHVGEVAAPHRGRRPALAPPRGNLEVHRPPGERQGAPLHLCDGRQVRHHQSQPAGAAEARQGPHRAVGRRLVRARQDRPRRRLARRRPQLAHRAARRAGARQVDVALLRRVRLGRPRAVPAVARHGRDRLRPAHQGRAAQDARRQLDLSQQRHPDVARARPAARWKMSRSRELVVALALLAGGCRRRAAPSRGRRRPCPARALPPRWPHPGHSASAARRGRRRSPAGTSTSGPTGKGLPPGKGTARAGRGAVHRESAPRATASSARAPGAGRCWRAAPARLRATTR